MSGQLNAGAPPDYHSIDVILWADPKNDAGTASSTVDNGVAFSGNTANDIPLATGEIVSGTMSMDMNSGVRMATYVEKLTPTLDGTLLLKGSIHQGDLLTEQFTTQPDEFQALQQPDGTIVDLVNGGRRRSCSPITTAVLIPSCCPTYLRTSSTSRCCGSCTTNLAQRTRRRIETLRC